MRLACHCFFCALFTLLLPGCGSSSGPVEPDLDLAPVAGVVTLNDQPLADANISFVFDGKPPKGFMASGAKSDSSGKFIVMTGSQPGTVPGRYKVTISRLRMPDGSPVKEEPGLDAAMLQQGGALKETVPERYTDPETTELSATVTNDGVDDLELKLTGS
ncbi:MAG TPA: carboxypeptidase-like regulatory domain-containing protein [Planctomycetaceae bacterium]|jgi:hypothetical protein